MVLIYTEEVGQFRWNVVGTHSKALGQDGKENLRL